MIPSTRPFETDCRIFTTLFGLILTHLFDWHSLKLFLRKVDVDVGFITVFIITGTECCRPKRRNIYSPRSMNLKTKELKRRQPKDESEIWLTPMRYHRSDVIHMTSSSVPERIFFLSRSFNYVIAYCYVNQQHSDRLVSGINCDGVSFGDSFSTFGIRTSSTIYYHDWVCTFHFRWLKNEHPIGYRYSRKNTCKPPEGDHTPNRFKMSVWQPYL